MVQPETYGTTQVVQREDVSAPETPASPWLPTGRTAALWAKPRYSVPGCAEL